MQQLTNSYRIFLLFGLFVLPFIYFPTAYVPYEIPKVWFFYFWTEALALIGLLAVIKGKPFAFGWLFKAVFGYICILALVSLIGVDLHKSVFGNYYRLDGLITTIHLFVFACVFSLFGNKDLLKDVALTAAIASFLTACGALIGHFYVISVSASGFGQPVFLGGYLAVTFPFLIYLLLEVKRKYKFLPILAMVASIWAIIITNTLGALLAVLFGIAIWVILTKKKKILPLFLVLFGLVGTLLIIGYLRQPFQTNLVFEGRQRIIIKTLAGLINERRILNGFGVANVDYAFDAGTWPVQVHGDVYLDKAHSTLLESMITGGVAGLTVYLLVLGALFFVLYRNAKSKTNKLLLTIFFVYILHAQTNVISIAEEIYFWLVLGYGFSKDFKFTES